jgi:hypothetical protein
MPVKAAFLIKDLLFILQFTSNCREKGKDKKR